MPICWIPFKDDRRITIKQYAGSGVYRRHSEPSVCAIVYGNDGRIYPKSSVAGNLEVDKEVGFYADFKLIGRDCWDCSKWYCFNIIFKDDTYCWTWGKKRMCCSERHAQYFRHPPWLTIGDRNVLFEVLTGFKQQDEEDGS